MPVPSGPPPPTITALVCFSEDAKYTGNVDHAGGTAPIEIRWSVNGGARSAFGDRVSLRVTVSDATGGVRRTAGVLCQGTGL